MLRRIILAAIVLLMLATVAICFRSFRTAEALTLCYPDDNALTVEASRGVLWIVTTRTVVTGWEIERWSEPPGRNTAEFWVATLGAESHAIRIPFYVLLAVLLATLWIVWRRRGGAIGGLCPSCGYDLRATPERCPECGRTQAVH